MIKDHMYVILLNQSTSRNLIKICKHFNVITSKCFTFHPYSFFKKHFKKSKISYFYKQPEKKSVKLCINFKVRE